MLVAIKRNGKQTLVHKQTQYSLTQGMTAKICPTVEDLEPLMCSEKTCGRTFNSIKACIFHQVKVHNILQKETDVTCSRNSLPKGKGQYHCPVQPCIYNPSKERHFSSFVLLRQHYLKVHKEKKYKCTSCTKGYATQTLLKLHENECGQLFKCGSCDNAYTTKATLQTHCRRHQHLYKLTNENCVTLKPKPKCSKVNNDKLIQNVDASLSTVDNNRLKLFVKSSEITQSPLIPKPDAMVICFDNEQVENTPTVILMAGAKQHVPKKLVGIKPKPEKKGKITTSPNTEISSTLSENAKQTIETQTENLQFSAKPMTKVQDSAVQAKPRKRNVVAQTTGDYILQTAMQKAKLPVGRTKDRSRISRKKSTETQCSHTQTAPVKKKKRNQMIEPQIIPIKKLSHTIDNELTLQPANVDMISNIPDLQELLDEFSISNNQTQTTTQWEDLQSCMAENNSTQTAESFLAASLNCQIHNSSSIETQTAMSMRQVSKQTCYNQTGQNTLPDPLLTSGTFLHNTTDPLSSAYYREVMLSDSATGVPPIGHEITINNTYSTIETQTVFPDLTVTSQDNSNHTSNVNMETQTLNDDILDEFLNHMETQTNEDFFADLGLADMETQTTFTWGPNNEMDFTNVQTQTSLHAHGTGLDNSHSTDMETQTWFPSLESYITGHSDCHTQTTLTDLEQLMSDLSQN